MIPNLHNREMSLNTWLSNTVYIYIYIYTDQTENNGQ